MKLICLLGEDPLQVLMPLHLTRLFDGAYLIVNEHTVDLAHQILAFLEANDDDGEGTPWRDAVHIVSIPQNTEYADAREAINKIAAAEYCRNEEVVFNYHSASKGSLKSAAANTAGHYLAPVMIVNPCSRKLKLLTKSWDRKNTYQEILPWIPLKTTVSNMLILSGLTWQRAFPKGGKGFGFERKIFSNFTEEIAKGEFDDVERNLLFTWNQTGRQNEIDIVALKKGVLCFISLKSGKNMKKSSAFKEE